MRAYPRETQEMVFDAHDKAFAFFGGACARGIYDNMKTAVDTIFVGHDRAYPQTSAAQRAVAELASVRASVRVFRRDGLMYIWVFLPRRLLRGQLE